MIGIALNYIHSHTHYSNIKMRDCIIKPEDSVNTSFNMGATAAFITDHDTLAGHVKFLSAVNKIREQGLQEYQNNPNAETLRKKNFKAVLGNEIYIAKEGMTGDTWVKGDKFYHLILLAKDRTGWSQLNELSTRAWSRSFKRAVVRVPTYISDLQEVVKKNPGHLIASSACLGNYLGDKILSFDKTRDETTKKEIISYINTMKDIFGEDFYLEIQPAEYPEQITYNNWLKSFANFTNTELVVATDNHYLKKEDRLIHSAYLNSEQDLKGERETDKFYKYTYFQSETEVREFLGLCENLTKSDIDKAIQNTFVIADKCEVYDIKSPISVPSIPYREKNWEVHIHQYDDWDVFYKFSHSPHEIDRYFLYKIIKGVNEKIAEGIMTGDKKELERLNTELYHVWEISEKIGQRLGNYFNTMQEMLQKIWEVSIVGPGRGSAAGFLINFILDITQVNPLTTPIELPYWRLIRVKSPQYKKPCEPAQGCA